MSHLLELGLVLVLALVVIYVNRQDGDEPW